MEQRIGHLPVRMPTGGGGDSAIWISLKSVSDGVFEFDEVQVEYNTSTEVFDFTESGIVNGVAREINGIANMVRVTPHYELARRVRADDGSAVWAFEMQPSKPPTDSENWVWALGSDGLIGWQRIKFHRV